MAGTVRGVGNVIAPWPYLVFASVFAVAGIAIGLLIDVTHGVLGGFDCGALAFLIACAPMFRHEAEQMRDSAKRNDANRVLILILSAAVMIVIMVAIGGVLLQPGKPKAADAALVIGTLSLSWLFTNLVYALHYAHLFYSQAWDGRDAGGVEIPNEETPDYWDFAYFSSCIGMTFQTSDSDITGRSIRKTAMFHAIAAFAFNIGVIAFAINVLGGG